VVFAGGCFAGRTAAMAIVDQKERYRRQAALCYEIAATMTGERAISMARLGDTYAALATDPDRLLPNVFASRKKYVDPVCKKCGQKMQLTHSLPRTQIMPAMQAFRCDACKETLIWKGEVSSVRLAKQSLGAAFPLRDRWITRYFVVSFRRVGGDLVPGPAVECPDASLAIQRAELMTRDKEIAGSVAFSRRGNPDTEEYDTAVILKTFGDIPPDFDMA
jgi:RNase P subunit RPR2